MGFVAGGRKREEQNWIECDPLYAQSAENLTYFTDLTEISPAAGKSVHAGKENVSLKLLLYSAIRHLNTVDV